MKQLEASSFAKINLGLRVLGRREDGFHEVRTVLQTIDLADRMTFEPDGEISLSVAGRYRVPADRSNLVLRAAQALAGRYPGHGARITLEKRIPAGAGLGGGSSNAAVTLLALDRLWNLEADPGLLFSLASGLGADVPFFLYGGACLALERGDQVLPLPDGPGWGVLVAWPGAGLPTSEVYSALPPALTRPRILSSMKGFMPGRKDEEAARRDDAGAPSPGGGGSAGPDPTPPSLENDLEPTAFGLLPGLRRLKERLLDAGAVAAAMSGSGSAVFGLFTSEKRLGKAAAALSADCDAVFPCQTLSREAYRVSQFERSRT